MIKRIFLFAFFAFISIFVAQKAQAASTSTCEQAQVEVVIKNFDGQLLMGSKFVIYEQIQDANGNPKPGKQVGSGSTDKYTGKGTAKVNVNDSLASYAVMVYNTTLKNADFWFFNELKLTCGSSVTGQIILGGFKIRVQDPVDYEVLRNIKVNIYGQKNDATGGIIPGNSLGSFTTGTSGDFVFYSPITARALAEYPDSLLMEVKDGKGRSYYKYGLVAKDKQGTYIDYRLSDLAVRLKDADTGNPLPGVKLELAEQKQNKIDKDLTPGKTLEQFTTDDKGEAVINYPSGTYMIIFRYPNGKIMQYPNIVIEAEQHNEIDLVLENYDSSKCSGKSNFKPVFRNSNGELLGNLDYTIYEQRTGADGTPLPDNRLISAHVDDYGNSKAQITPAPAKRYAMELCDRSVKNACFWFFDITMTCGEDIVFEKTLPQTSIILRDAKNQLAVGKKFKIYVKQVNIDGKAVVDKSRQVGSFEIPSSGKLVLRLSPVNSRNSDQSYFLVVDDKAGELQKEIVPQSEGDVTLEYSIVGAKLVAKISDSKPDNNNTSPEQTQPAGSTSKGLKGKILLQVESKGEAWYVNPKNNLRYYLGKPEDAFAVMRRLSVGIKKADLDKIPVALAMSSGPDDDGDGLSNDLELALGTSYALADSDNDGFTDFQEISGGYNPAGNGKMPINEKFAAAQSGKILLQVDGRGEAWYVFPVTNRRYFLGRPNDAYFVMRELGLGVSNNDISKITIGK